MDEQRMNEEIQFHLEMREAELMRQGLTREEARRKVGLEFGSIDKAKEEVREGRRLDWMRQGLQDWKYALRGCRRNPGFFAAAVGTLALGIGITSVIVTLIYGLVYRPLQARDPERLVNVHLQTFGEGERSTYGTQYFVTWQEFGRLREGSRTTELAGMAEIRVSWKGYTERPVGTLLISCNLPSLLGAQPAMGRFFTAEECAQPRSAPVVVLTHGFWQSAFGGDPKVVGRTMTLNRVPFLVIGVARADVPAPVMLQPDIWVPITMQGITAPERQFLEDRQAAWIQIFGRLRPGESAATAQAELATLGTQAVHEVLPKKTVEVTVTQAALLSFPGVVRSSRVVMALLVGAGLLILLLGCANVANLLLARGLSRSREIAVRLALGAGRGRLVRQMLAESLVLAVAAGLAGLMVASIAGRGLMLVFASVVEPLLGRANLTVDLQPDWRITLFALTLALLTGLVFGLVPALQASKLDLGPALHGTTSTLSPRRAWLQSGLVALQVAVCAVLLLNSVLLVQGLRSAMALEPGMARENVLIAGFDLRQQQYTPERARVLLERLLEEGEALPGVERAAASSMVPFQGRNTVSIRVEGYDDAARPPLNVLNQEGTEDYLETLSIPLRAGRMFTAAERRSQSRVVLVSEDLARTVFGAKNPLGRRIGIGPGNRYDSEIIGVTGPVRGLSPAQGEIPALLHPLGGSRWMEATLLFKVRGDSAGIAKRLQELGASLDGELNVRVNRIEENANSALAASRIAVGFSAVLAGLALILSCSGIAGVVAFAVERRRREVGIRMALGSSHGDAVGLMMRRGLKPVMMGLVVGILAALGVARLLETMLYGVRPSDPLSVGVGAVLLTAVAALAAWVPARTAARVDPARVLRAD